MRDCLFWVADSRIKQVILGFLKRPDCFRLHNLGTSPFLFDENEDLFSSPTMDPGTYTTGQEFIRLYQRSHRFAVVILDSDWKGSPGAAAIRTNLSVRIESTGWTPERFRVVVIEPELEDWIWQRNQRVAGALGFESHLEMAVAVQNAGHDWPDHEPKPSRPKEAFEAVAARAKRLGKSSATHRQIVAAVTLAGCRDAAFRELRETLQGWFPLEKHS
jgi:hypothetical protein